MTKLKFTVESDDVPAWVRSLLDETREERPATVAPSAAEPSSPRRIVRKRGPMECKVEVRRYRWNRAHGALTASGEPHEATVTDGGVLVTTTAEGRRLLEEFEA